MYVRYLTDFIRALWETPRHKPEDVKEIFVMHYHIRWSNLRNSKLDWQVFDTPEEAQTEAEQLVRPGESYSVEKFEGDCPRCADLLTRRKSA